MEHLKIIEPYLNQIKTTEETLDNKALSEAILKLEPLVERMLQSNMNQVLNFLYRLDISEEKVKHILFGDHKEKASLLLSEAIVKREIVRRIFRLKYSS